VLTDIAVDCRGQCGSDIRGRSSESGRKCIFSIDQNIARGDFDAVRNATAGQLPLNLETLQAQALARRRIDRHRNLIVFLHTRLNRHALGRAIQQLDPVEVGGLGDVVDLLDQLIHFLLQRHTVARGQAAV